MCTVISLNNIQKSFGDRKILDHFSCVFKQHQFTIITGKSGKGKTTLLHLIGLLDQDFSGEYLLFGQNIRSLKPSKKDLIRNRSIGFIFQNYHLIPGLDMQSNIMLPSIYSPLSGNPISKKISQRTEDLIGMFHLESLQNRDIRTLSGGEQQRIAIARALLMDPDVILADEPTGNLDESNTNMIMDQFRNLTDQGKTVIMVTHDRSIADRADRIIEL